MTTVEPLSTEIAIAHKRKIILPEYPPIKIVYFSKKRFDTGIIVQKIEDREILIRELSNFFSEEMKQIFEIQREYFGDEVFSHIRNKSIKVMSEWYQYSVENNIT